MELHLLWDGLLCPGSFQPWILEPISCFPQFPTIPFGFETWDQWRYWLYFNLIVTNCFEAFRKYFKIRMQKRISWNPYGPLALGAAAPVCSPGVLLLPAGEGARWEGGCYLLLLRSFHQKSRKPWKWSAASKFIIRKSDVERKWIAVHVIFLDAMQTSFA